MICCNCGHEYMSGNICPACGADNVLLIKAKTASLRQYNKGVSYAREGDYSAAIEALRECLLFDKYNFVARNLLGIAYFQTGLVTDAIREWIISTSIKKEKNPAQKYIDSLQKSGRFLEKCGDAIGLYNSALEQFKLGKNDLAVISLKKAADINPSFTEAQNVLTAYYISIKDRQKAKKYISKVLKTDKRNPRALEYLSELTNQEDIIHIDKRDLKNGNGGGYNENLAKGSSVSFYKRFKKIFKSQLFVFLFGAAISAVIFATLAVPALTDMKSTTIDNLNKRIQTLEDENANGSSTFAMKYKNLEAEVTRLQKENDEYKAQYSAQQQQLDIENAKSFIEKNEYSQAASLLNKIDDSLFDDNTKSEVSALRSQCYPQAAEEIYSSGVQKLQDGNTTEAQNDFLLAVKLAPKSDKADNALYFLAEIEETNGNPSQAKSYYERIVNEFSNSDVYKEAESKIMELSKNVQQ